MAEFAPGFSTENILNSQLRCSSCSVYMKPPIYKCSSDHSVCSKCWTSQEKCSKCDEEYKKVLKTEVQPDHIYVYRCSCGRFEQTCGSHSILESYVWNHYRNFYLQCGACGESKCFYPMNQKLNTEDEFRSMQTAFKPLRNCQLEALTAFMVYPCEMEGCSEKISIEKQKEHEANCTYRPVVCPYVGCEWKDPVRSLVEHVSDVTTHPDCTTFDPKDGKPLVLHFEVPPKLVDVGNASSEFRKVFILNGSTKVAFCVCLNFPGPLDKDLLFSVEAIGQKSESNKLSFEVKLQSKFPQRFIALGTEAQHDMEAAKEKNWEPLRSFLYLKNGGYAEFSENQWKIALHVKVIEKKQAAAMLPVAPNTASLAESVD